MMLILASQSEQRRSLLATMVGDFSVLPADIDELAIDHDDHIYRAELVAVAKAEKIASLHRDAYIIAADTFVLHEGKRLEKPASEEEARMMLKSMSGKKVQVLTGICWQHGAEVESDTVVAYVTFRTLSPSEIDTYVTGRPVTTWAGGFSLKDIYGLSLVTEIDGSVSAVEGLPLEWLQPRLQAAGFFDQKDSTL